MRKLALLLLALPLMAIGQTSDIQGQEELRLVETLYYDRGEYIASDVEREKLNGLIEEMIADKTIKVCVVGYCDKWGGKVVNDRFSYVRAMYIADWMRSCKVAREQIVFMGEGIDSLAASDKEARRVELRQVVEDARAAKPTGDVDPMMQVEPQPKPQPKPKPQPQPKPAAVAQAAQPAPQAPQAAQAAQASAQKKCDFKWSDITLRTNLLYWLSGMINIGAEWHPDDSSLGVVLNGGYSPFGGANWEHAIGGWYVSPELRYYIPQHSEWFVGAQFLAQGVNFKLRHTGYQGTILGGGVLGGYKLTLTECFDMDFTLGVGYATINYDKYYHSKGVNVIMLSDLTKSTIIPIQAGVNLIWKIK